MRERSPFALRPIRTLRSALVGFALGVACAAGSGAAELTVTSVTGDGSANGRGLALHSPVEVGEVVELSHGARVSLLVGDATLVRLCDLASARFAAEADGAASGVELQRGELNATRSAGAGPLTILTPTASVQVLGAGVHVSVIAGSGATTVSSLDGRARVSRRKGKSGSVLLHTDQQVAVERGRTLGSVRRFDAAALRDASDCLGRGGDRSRAVAASSRLLLVAPPPVSANADGAVEAASDLAQIVAADIPEDDVPLEQASTPSALIAELSKAGLDEEVCDPITCNPVYQLPTPEICGVPPQTGCIPGP